MHFSGRNAFFLQLWHFRLHTATGPFCGRPFSLRVTARPLQNACWESDTSECPNTTQQTAHPTIGQIPQMLPAVNQARKPSRVYAPFMRFGTTTILKCILGRPLASGAPIIELERKNVKNVFVLSLKKHTVVPCGSPNRSTPQVMPLTSWQRHITIFTKAFQSVHSQFFHLNSQLGSSKKIQQQ